MPALQILLVVRHHQPGRVTQILERKRLEAEHDAMLARWHLDAAEQDIGAQDRHARAIDLGDPARIIGVVQREHAAVAGAAPNHLRGSAFGLLAAVQSFGNLAASAIAGLLWTAFSPSWAFAYLAAWMLLALVLLLAARAVQPSVDAPVAS